MQIVELLLSGVSDPVILKLPEKINLMTVIEAAGFKQRQSCLNGACGICRCRLISGEISYGHRLPSGLWQRDIEQGYILPCIAYKPSDSAIDNRC